MSDLTLEQRTEYVLRKLDHWTENMKANAKRSAQNGEAETAGRLEHQAAVYAELAFMLRGGEDSYIATVLSLTSKS